MNYRWGMYLFPHGGSFLLTFCLFAWFNFFPKISSLSKHVGEENPQSSLSIFILKLSTITFLFYPWGSCFVSWVLVLGSVFTFDMENPLSLNLAPCEAFLPSWLRFSLFSLTSVNTLVTLQVFQLPTMLVVSQFLFCWFNDMHFVAFYS